MTAGGLSDGPACVALQSGSGEAALISGGLFRHGWHGDAAGAVVCWWRQCCGCRTWTLSLIHALLVVAGVNLLFAGVSLRSAGRC